MTATAATAPPSLAELLAFYAESGVDDAIEEHGVNRLAENRPTESNLAETRRARPQVEPGASRQAPTQPARTAPQVAVPDDKQAARARQLADSASSLDELKAVMTAFDGCNLKSTAKQLVFADGNPQARLMLVGKAPGRDEDIEGRPFVGRSGQLLDRMLAAIGLDRTTVYIANVVPWRPPGNRTPTPHETEICRPFIERQIELANPDVLVTLGGPSAKTLLNIPEGILKSRGGWLAYPCRSGRTIPALPTLHPAYLLRNPAHKKLAWRDLLEIKMKLAATAT